MPNDENSEKQVIIVVIGARDISASVLHLVVRDPNHPLEGRVRPRPQWPHDGRGPSPTRLAEVMEKARAS